MPIRIAINGFGRIGRLVLRSIVETGTDDFDIVAVNDLSDNKSLTHLLKYDSVHGRFPKPVTYEGNIMRTDGHTIAMSAQRDPENLLWKELDVDIVMECTGIFRTAETAGKHIKAGAKRVLMSAPSKDDTKMVVYGINHHSITKDDIIVSNASCTTNALAPLVGPLHDTYGIKDGMMTTIHAYTGSQPTLDRVHKDLYRGRAAALSMIPTTTGAAKAIGRVIPELDRRLTGIAVRVPVPNVSIVDLTVNLKTETNVKEIQGFFKDLSEGKLKGILGYETEKLVSLDFNHDPHSSTFVEDQVLMQGGMLRVFSWYDNEWGFSNRMLDTARVIGKTL